MSDQPGPDLDPFNAETVSAVCAHMNDDHAADTLLICRALGGRPDAVAARMVGLDADGGDFVVASNVGAQPDQPLRIPWSRRLTGRAEVRAEVVRMYGESCARLGVERSPGGEH